MPAFLLLSLGAQAQAFVYTPRNPAFGGNTFNYQWMLSGAAAQDTYKRQGEDQLEPGTFQFGDLTVEITEGSDGLTIRIVDGQGGESTVTVPYF